MTTEERAREVLAAAFERRGDVSVAHMLRTFTHLNEDGPYAPTIAAMHTFAAQARAEAIEECAKVAESGWEKYAEPTERDYGAQDACMSVSRAIRSLDNQLKG